MVPWTPYNHPQYGLIEIGGVKKQYAAWPCPASCCLPRRTGTWRSRCTRPRQMPLVRGGLGRRRRSLGGGLTEVTAIVANKRLAPTHTQQDLENHITRPDWVTLDGR